jgi:TonB family protein
MVSPIRGEQAMRTIVLTGVAFLALSAGMAMAQSAFVKKPAAEDFDRLYPTTAKGSGVGGTVNLTCKVAAGGLLEDCTTGSELPAGMGFGEAALKLAPLFQMAPTVTGKITIPIRFGLTAPAAAPGAAPQILTGPYFIAKPSPSEVVEVYPKAALAAHTSGAAQIRCTVDALGKLNNCAVEAENPAGQGFGAAALKLAPMYKLNPLTYDGKPVTGGSIAIPITFSATAG